MNCQYQWLIFLCLFTLLQIGNVNADTDLEVMDVVERTFPQHEVFDAVVEATHQATVSSRIAAEVIELNFDVNDVVPKGAIIMKFRDEEFHARVAQIEASILADKAQSREASARKIEVASEAKRVKDLFKRKLVPQAAFDKVNADLSAANARHQAVQAQLKSRQAQLDEAKVKLSYTKIIAPYGGVVTERLIELGEMASPGQHLMTGISLEYLRAVVNVPQYLVSSIKSAENSTLTLPDGRQISGEEFTVIPYADSKSHSFHIRVDLPIGTENLYPGTFGKLGFVVGEEQVTVISQSAVVQRSEVSGVYVLTDNQYLTFRQIRLGRLMADGQREVLAGLTVGEKIALDPLQAARLLKQNSSRSHP
jgi:RND family efflux transporter MFP subunit